MKGNNLIKWSLVFVLIFINLIGFSYLLGSPQFNRQPKVNLEEERKAIENGKDVNEFVQLGKNALMIAAIYGDEEMVDFLLEKGADVNSVSLINNETPLFFAAVNQHKEIVYKLISEGATYNINFRTYFNETYLMAFSKCGLADLVEELLEKGADINEKNSHNETSLNYAIKGGSLEIVKFLIDKGADINEQNWDSIIESTFHIKDCSLISYIFEIIFRKKFDKIRGVPLITISINNIKDFQESIFPKCIKENCLLKNENIYKFVLLNNSQYFYQCVYEILDSQCFYDLLDSLIIYDADIDILNKEDLIISAINDNKFALISFLTKKGINLDIKTYSGKSLLTIAVEKGKVEIVKLFVEKKIDLNFKDNVGFTALMYASISGNIEIVKLLVENGANINERCNSNWTALTLAKLNKRTEIIEYLLSKGAEE